MTQEEKAKAYDKAIRIAEALYKASESMSACNVIIETIFPELKESEDERIRKEIIDFIYDKTNTYELREKSNSWLAWLEKQGEQKSDEWSEEDENFFNDTLAFLKDTKSALDHVDWLKSLKQRIEK